MNRTALTAGSLLVCLLMTLSALAGLAVENHEQAPSELTETEPMHIGGTDPTSFVAPDTSGFVGYYTSTAIDSNNVVHISYYDGTNGDLKYATNASGYWTTVSVDTTGIVGLYTSIAIDSNNDVHISYYDVSNYDLKYATCSSGCTTASNWNDVSVDTIGDVGLYTSIAIDSNNDVHISYYDVSNKDLKYAYSCTSCITASNWYRVSVDTGGSVGLYTSIAIDSNDDVHISYTDSTNANLKYATCSSGCTFASHWNDVSVDTTGVVGTDTSIAIDSNDAVHISYLYSSNYDLKYATCSSVCTFAINWNDASVDTTGNVGTRTSIAIDSNDDVHISYYDASNKDLKYATCSSGCTSASNWNDVSVDTTGIVGLYTSIAIDSNDAVHISYFDSTNGDLKLAYDKDTDFDQVLDKNDACPYNYGTSTEDRIGCIDTDGDGWSDLGDDFHNKATQWKDSDGDGLGDNWGNTAWNNTRESHWPGEWVANAYLADASPFDFDNDGYEDEDIDDAEEGEGWDACPTLYGTSSEDRSGCIDSDGDGYSNPTSNWNVSDGADEFPGASTQWIDTDDDGYGDNPYGNFPDSCVSLYGTSYIDVYGCYDGDSDGYSNLSDVDDTDDEEAEDSDGDGYGDYSDDFPYDSTQWLDSDDDGFGDNASGNDPDAFPNDSDEWSDSDGDGHGDNEADEFPYDATQFEDDDGDGYGDNSSGNNPDMFPNDENEWDDSDGDGYGDNEDDAFPYDATQYEDDDGDGYGDNSTGNDADAFPTDSSEWADTDGDGYGDNSQDYCPYVSGNISSGLYTGCPDADGDSYADLEDAFDNDATQWSDSDGDGYGDNSTGTNPDYCPMDSGTSTTAVFYNSTSLTLENITAYGCVDSDGDGFEDYSDSCPFTYGNSWADSTACPDADLDGISDAYDPYPNNATNNVQDWDNDTYLDHAPDPINNTDAFPNDNSQWNDTDMDGFGDNPNGSSADAFPLDWSQWSDADGDGYGDNEFGNESDGCIFSFGNSTIDRRGCADSDGDGYSNPDGDWSVNEGADAFTTEPSQWSDYDGDGYGDNSTGMNPDSCQGQAGSSTLTVFYNNTNGQLSNVTYYGCPDEDNDGYEDSADPCPYTYGNSWVDMMACPDADQDGISDTNDPLPQTPTNSSIDWDGDGVTDHAFNQLLNIDHFPTDPTQWVDTDGDGYGDNSTGNNPDAFPNEPSQWEDSDGDGYGDNTGGYDGDQCIYTSGNSTMPYFGCLDSDGDGWANEYDDFDDDDSQWHDMDGDGYGDEMTGTNPDQCPNQPGTSTKRVGPNGENETSYGCEDRDNDGYEDQSDPCPNQYGTSWIDQMGCVDDDGDGISNINDPEPYIATTNVEDWDGDGYLDHAADVSLNNDHFPLESTQWMDSDGDGFGDNPNGLNYDAFPNESSQWLDSDDDGYGDNTEIWAFQPDACAYQNGNSTADRYGCIDSDGDGYSDASSNWLAFPYGAADSLPYDASQHEDLDGDGCGDNYQFSIDNSTGLRTESGDAFPNDSEQCSDLDGDGYGEEDDAFPENELEWEDSDRDEIGDNSDDFPFDRTQWKDTDGDGYGDNEDGRDADDFPSDPSEHLDSDGDGFGDNSDMFPNDPTETVDSDSDGYGDNKDAFPNDPSQWKDSDYDGYGDEYYFTVAADGSHENQAGDQFPRDPTQWRDTDLDQHGDNTWGNNPDAFIFDNQEWKDDDGDGLGDNEADKCYDVDSGELRMCTLDADNDGFNDDVDQFPNEKTQWDDGDLDGKGDNCRFIEIREGVYGTNIDGVQIEYLNINSTTAFNGDCSLNDRDNDGRKDPANPEYTDANRVQIKKESLACERFGSIEICEDAFPDDPNEWADNDEDGIGDNADQDDDNDGVSDKVEEDAGTDSFSSADKPFAGVTLPVLDVKLQEWDLITIGIGGPSALYLAFTFLSRNRRTEEFEQLIHEAQTELELRAISDKYERAMQMRLIGTHQGLRLERIRSKRENILEYEMVEQHNSEVENQPKQVVPLSNEEE